MTVRLHQQLKGQLMIRWLSIVLGVVILTANLWATDAMAQDPDKNVEKFMRAKLVHAQKLLEALALEDFDALVKHSQDLDLLSQATTWQVMQTAEYLAHSKEFQRSAQSLNEAAKKKNIDGASLAYVEMTFKCVNCHKYVRHIRTAQAGPSLQTLFIHR
jgi:cytochrome c556